MLQSLTKWHAPCFSCFGFSCSGLGAVLLRSGQLPQEDDFLFYFSHTGVAVPDESSHQKWRHVQTLLDWHFHRSYLENTFSPQRLLIQSHIRSHSGFSVLRKDTSALALWLMADLCYLSYVHPHSSANFVSSVGAGRFTRSVSPPDLQAELQAAVGPCTTFET